MKQTSETIELGIFLALAGGFMDAYSYICRGKVFANAQTGNMLLFGVKISQGEFQSAFRYAQPVIAFSIGILLADIVRHKISDNNKNIRRFFHWRQITVLIEIIILAIVCFIPQTHNTIANSLTSMACGMQVESFRKIYGNNIATTMCIGNLRSATENLYGFLKSRSINFLYKSVLYYFVIICFVIGAILGNFAVKLYGELSMFGCIFFLLIGFFMMMKEEIGTIMKF